MLEQLQKFMCEVVFSGDDNIDPNGCANALAAAGLIVHRMDPKYRQLMAVEGDEFLDVVGHSTSTNAFWEKIAAIAAPFGGDVAEGGEIDGSYVPLQFLRDQEAKLAT
jgi:hypothetical protein